MATTPTHTPEMTTTTQEAGMKTTGKTTTTFRRRYAEALTRMMRRQFAAPSVRAADARAVKHYEGLPEYRAYIAECDAARAALHHRGSEHV